MEIGAQLYTVRNFTKDLDSFAETLKRIADIGYKTVQVSGTCPFESEWLKEELRKNGLRCVVTHTAPDKIINDTEKVIADHKTFGCQYIGIGSFNIRGEGLEAFVNTYRDAARKIKEAGLSLMYHNHDGEFDKAETGEIYLAQMIRSFPGDQLGFTLDTYWVQRGGGDPIDWIYRLKGRTPCVHFKDMAYDLKMAPVGEGNMNFEGIIKACVDAGVKYALVEQDHCNDEDPFDCLTRSYQYLKARGFE